MNLIPISSSDLQGILLDNLRAFSDYCKRNNLTFFATGGTLLGAIRHNGFIPWDDDVDVAMMPQEFEKLTSLAKIDPYLDKDRRYRIFLPGEDPNFFAFIKVVDTRTVLYQKNVKRDLAMGVWIDVFCLDQWPNSEKNRERIYRRQRFYSLLNKALVFGEPQGAVYKLAYPFACVFRFVERLLHIDSSWCVDKMISLAASCEGDHVGSVRWPIGRNDRYPEECFKESIEVNFEDLKLLAPVGYKEVLRSLYGDFMKLPPEEQRIGHEYELYYVN